MCFSFCLHVWKNGLQCLVLTSRRDGTRVKATGRVPHVSAVATQSQCIHTQIVTVFLSSSTRRLVLQWRNLHTNSERWVLHFNSQGQDVSQGLSSRTVTSMSLISIVIRRLYQTCVDL